MDGCLSKRTRQKELKRCHTAAAESLSHPSPIHKVTSQPIAANPLWSSYPDAAEKRGSAAVKAFFFFFFVNLQGASWCSYPQRASKRAWVCDGSRGVAFAHQWAARKAKSCSFTHGVVDARIQSTPPSKLQKQVSVPRCKKRFFDTCLLFSRSRVDRTISFDAACWYCSAARPPSICCSVCCGILFLLLWQHKLSD